MPEELRLLQCAQLGLSRVKGRVLAPRPLLTSLRSTRSYLATESVLWALTQALPQVPALLVLQGLRVLQILAQSPLVRELRTHSKAGANAAHAGQGTAAATSLMQCAHSQSQSQALTVV